MSGTAERVWPGRGGWDAQNNILPGSPGSTDLWQYYTDTSIVQGNETIDCSPLWSEKKRNHTVNHNYILLLSLGSSKDLLATTISKTHNKKCLKQIECFHSRPSPQTKKTLSEYGQQTGPPGLLQSSLGICTKFFRYGITKTHSTFAIMKFECK